MEKFPIDSSSGPRLASLIEHRLRGDQRLFLVSIGAAEPAEDTERQAARDELLALIDEMQHNVSAAGISDDELASAIDEAIADVRASDH